jgi:hypothetical protein
MREEGKIREGGGEEEAVNSFGMTIRTFAPVLFLGPTPYRDH